MNEVERIEAMRAAGTISDAEAERLIRVLREIGAAPADAPSADPSDQGATATSDPASGGGIRELGAPAAAVPEAGRQAPEPPPPASAETPPKALPNLEPVLEPEPEAASAASGDEVRRARDAGREAERRVRDAAREAERDVREAAHQARDAAREAAHAARNAAREAVRSGRHDAEEAAQIAREAVRAGTERLRAAFGTGASSPPRDPEATTERDATPTDVAPPGTPWLAIGLLAGDVEVFAGDVAQPEIASGEGVHLEADGAGSRLVVERDHSLLGRLRPVDVELRVPRHWGVDLDVKAGDLTLRDVAFVRGRVLAGDIEVRAATGIDLECGAGDLSVSLRPTVGRHRLSARAGDLDVRLLAGSDVEVTGHLSLGDATARGFSLERRGLGAAVTGRLGAGRAHLAVELGAGDLILRAETEG
jgi:hypothetical protein